MYILCRNREDCTTASEHIFYVEDWATASGRKYAADIFICWSKCVAASEIISMFSNERAAASESIKKNVQLLARIMST